MLSNCFFVRYFLFWLMIWTPVIQSNFFNIHAQEITLGGRHEETTLVYPPFRHAPVHKATGVHLLAFMALIGRTDIRPDNPQGIAVTRLKATDDPQNRNDDDDLTAYGINSGQNLIIFNSSIQSLDVYEGKGRLQRLNAPRGIACTSAGDVYVTDTDNHRIVRLHNPGTHLAFVDAHGKKGSKPGEFKHPHGIAVGPAGRVYVADTENDRIQVFDRDMRYQFTIGAASDTSRPEETVYRPDALAIAGADDEPLFIPEQFLIAVDLNNTRIRKFTVDGKFISGILSNDYGYPKAFLTGAAIDYYGNVWVTDAFHHCVHKFDKDLRYITSFGRVGENDNQFLEPRSIAIWKPMGQVFIVDKLSAQYFHIGTDILEPAITMKDSTIFFDFTLTEHSRVTVTIRDETDRIIATLCLNRLFPLGRHQLTWNRMKDPPKLRQPLDSLQSSIARDSTVTLPSGLYSIRWEARTTYRYSRYFTKTLEIDFAF